MAVWTALPVFALGAAGLTVDSLSPDALCPPLEETRTAVAARLGSVELEGTWRATYLLVHRTQGDFVALSLRDPDGVLRLERDLPVQGGACQSLSRVIALVLERYFLRPEQAAPDETPTKPVSEPAVEAKSSELATPTPMSAPASDAVAVPAPPPQQDAPTIEPRQPPANRLSAALWASTDWTAPTLGFARLVTGPYRLSLTAGLDLNDHETPAFEGSLTVRRAPLTLGCEREFRLGSSISAFGAVEVLGVLEQAKTIGIAEPGGGFRVVPGVGARLGSHFFTQSPVQPFAELTAAWLMRAAAPAFQVGGTEVLRPSALIFGLALGIATPF
ncbi:MAG TPA: hypothetical protein VHP33_12250 [Polyangiaceae bacterium]|nr:hypothetical protein [Polyangiaceae bacterium]